jgi:hypothetical protein
LFYDARVTLFERRQWVQILMVLAVPFSTMRIFLTLGFQVLLARRETWLRVMLILWPVRMDLSHISHFAIVVTSFLFIANILSEKAAQRNTDWQIFLLLVFFAEF